MTHLRSAAAIVVLLALAIPLSAKTYKNAYPNTCSQLWNGVKFVLANQDNYAVESIEEMAMTAAYQPKHSVHFDVSGVILQRMNHVKLLPKGSGCELDVGSNYSGWGHDDQGDFKKRVEDALANPQPAPEVKITKNVDATKQQAQPKDASKPDSPQK